MSLTRRGKTTLAAVTALLVAGGAIGYFALFPDNAPAIVRSGLTSVGLVEEAPPAPPPCPLTGQPAPVAGVPDRPALAIKVENHPDARPQAALNDADIVVEEPVEGGYTRFIAVFQCGDSERVGPVRSGRTTDLDYLVQLGPAVFGYAGGVPVVKREVPRVGLTDVNYIIAADAYTRDDAREAPHNLYSTTAALWKAGASTAAAPEPLFTYADAFEGSSRKVSGMRVPYSGVSDVVWTWSRREGAWLRAHGDVAHALEGGDQVSATNVVIQLVRVSASTITDAAGNYSPDVDLTGSGKAFVLRDGRLIAGRWERATLDDLTVFRTKDGEIIPLAPGRTWLELVPTTVAVTSIR